MLKQTPAIRPGPGRLVFQIALIDDEHEDGRAWTTIRYANTALQIKKSCLQWLDQVRACGAKVYRPIYRMHTEPKSDWKRV